jgi:hypothetical protein
MYSQPEYVPPDNKSSGISLGKVFIFSTTAILLLIGLAIAVQYDQIPWEEARKPSGISNFTIAQIMAIAASIFALISGIIFTAMIASVRAFSGFTSSISDRIAASQHVSSKKMQMVEEPDYSNGFFATDVEQWHDMKFSLKNLGEGKVEQVYGNRTTSQLSSGMMITIGLWIASIYAAYLGYPRFLVLFTTVIVLASLRMNRSYLQLIANDIEFRNVFTTHRLSVYDLDHIESVIYTVSGGPGNTEGNLSDKISFTTKQGDSHSFFIAAHNRVLLPTVKTFASNHTIEFVETWKKGPSHN